MCGPLPVLLPLRAGPAVGAPDEAPDILKVPLVRDLEHDEVVPYLVDGIWDAVLLAVLQEYYREAVELEAHLTDVIGLGVRDVKGDVRSLMGIDFEHAGVLLPTLLEGSLVKLGGVVPLRAITEAPLSLMLLPRIIRR